MNRFFNNLHHVAENYAGNRTRSSPRPRISVHTDMSGGAFDVAHDVFGNDVHTRDNNSQPGLVPPASQTSIRQLPTVQVMPEDLIDENNRSCCICFEDNNLGDRVARLPCAHIYHTHCITEWLRKQCTCPVCRYELPTDSQSYEHGRRIRMSQRKPRFAKYELERMSPKELKDICHRLSIPMICLGGDKAQVIQSILDSGKIDVIASPKPVEYDNIDLLRSMTIGQLKKAMADAGVFFDAKFVIEKEDMVQIFVNSGRIIFLAPIVELKEDVADVISDQDDGKMSHHPPISEKLFMDEHEIFQEHEDDSNSSVQSSQVRFNDILSSDNIHQSMDVQDNNTTGNGNNMEMSIIDSVRHDEVPDISMQSVPDLKRLARQLGVNISDCIEKREILERIRSYYLRR